MSIRFSRRDVLKGLGAAWGMGAVSPLLTACGADDDAGTLVEGMTAAGAGSLERYDKIVILMMENRSFDHVFGYRSIPRGTKDVYGTDLGGEGRSDVNGLRGDESNPTGEKHFESFRIFRPVSRQGEPIYFIGDIDHEWEACHEQLNYEAYSEAFAGAQEPNRFAALPDPRGVAGKNDGFIRAHRKDLNGTRSGGADCIASKLCAADDEPMAIYSRSDMPIFGGFADNYAIADNYFCSVIGPTWPNRFYMHMGTALGATVNQPAFRTNGSSLGSINQFGTIWSVAAMTRKSGNEPLRAVNYFADTPWALGGFQKVRGLAPVFEDQSRLGRLVASLEGTDLLRILTQREEDTFEAACKKGTLPDISVIDPPFLLAPGDDHPPHHVHGGQAFVATVYSMLYGPTANKAQAARTLFIITYDEHGSFYDHVVPPVLGSEEFDVPFRQLGFRVPTLVIGPGVKRGHVSHTQYDHVSLIKTLTDRFHLDWVKAAAEGKLSGELAARQKARNERIAKANSLADCIDPSRRSEASAPTAIPRLSLDHDVLYDSIVFSDGQTQLHDTMGSLKSKLTARITRLQGAIKGAVSKSVAEVKSEQINHLLAKAKEYTAASVREGSARGSGTGERIELTVEAPEHKR